MHRNIACEGRWNAGIDEGDAPARKEEAMRIPLVSLVVLLVLGAGVTLGASEGQQDRKRNSPKQPRQDSVCNDVPARPMDVILVRPTRDSVTLSVLAYQDMEGRVVYGLQQTQLEHETPIRRFVANEPTEVRIGSLDSDARYFYALRTRDGGAVEGNFHTQRPPGSSFTFTITADSHLDERTRPELYQCTLANVLADGADFHIDLGDTFMSEKHDSRAHAARQYLAQRYYFGQVCRQSPLFLVLGNHDGESPRGRVADADSLCVWSNRMRKRYFPNPFPDGFYTGNADEHPNAGLLQDYFAWHWGDALFVVLDPFWFSTRGRGGRDIWTCSLGPDQYRWLARTLSTSKDPLKFVFTHHLVGGATPEGRGGVEAAPFFEWGGKNRDGSEGFREHRPGWAMPIHELLVRNRVTAVFHGHDHLYARQELDGVVYQEVPQPGTPGQRKPRMAEEYGYKTGVVLGSPGYLRVRVTAGKATVDYVGSILPDGIPKGRRTGGGEHSYALPAEPGSASEQP